VVVVLPGVREAVRRKDRATAVQQLGLVRGAVERGTVTLTQALQTLGEEGATPGHALARGALSAPVESREGSLPRRSRGALPYRATGGQ
jgi:hypothetical protein